MFCFVLWSINFCRLIRNSVYIYIYIYICVCVCVCVCVWLQAILFNTNNSIQYYSFTCTSSNGSSYCNAILIIQLRDTVKYFLVLQYISNTSIKYHSCAYTQLNGKTVLFLTIQFNISPFIWSEIKFKTVLFDPKMGPYQILPLQVRVDLVVMVMKGYSTFPKTPGLKPHHMIG